MRSPRDSGYLPSYRLADVAGRGLFFDAFERMRTAEPHSIFDSKQVYDAQTSQMETDVSGGASITYDNQKSASDLTTSTASGDRATRQSKRYMNYQPGKGMEMFITFNLEGGVANVDKRVGYFDNDNGVFLKLDGDGASFVLRSNVSGSVVDTEVAQSNWNFDSLDGSGPSGLTLDLTKTQILGIDFQWLGVGLVAVGFDIGGKIYPAHGFAHSNIETEVYWQTPNLPVRWEIENTGTAVGAPNMQSICCSAMVSGGLEGSGITRSASRGTSGTAIGSSVEPVMSIRLKSSHNRATVVPESFSVLSAGNSDFYWQLVMNPTITGGTAASWVSGGDAVEYDITADGVVSAGDVIASGYSSNNTSIANVEIGRFLSLASDYSGTSDVLVLAVNIIGGGSDTFYGSMTWLEAA